MMQMFINTVEFLMLAPSNNKVVYVRSTEWRMNFWRRAAVCDLKK